uniref:[histone H3]-lysine(4) N-trimethyltransferase n=1 Tax=Phallusia mammillata TaxID=59560 RepID=A0A6F9DTW6_9ASCI|nr:histone-lysine N-methyltransferase SMYD3-like [Phallusia mammillata]
MIEVFHSAEKGRGLCTKSGLLRGSVVLSCDPFVYVLTKSQKGVRCDHCLKRQDTLLRCSGCKFMRYCDRKCQKGAWHQHKPECAALKRVSPKIPPDFVILLSRVLWKLEDSMDDNKPEDLISIVDLESNYSRLTDSQKEGLGQFVVVLHSYWGQGALPLQVPDIKAVLELCAKIKNNSFAISDEEMQADIGTGVYLSCSLLNHSCEPNCVAEFDQMRLNIRALRDIDQGEELLISYTDLFAPTCDRQEELMNVYRFQCKCVACTSCRHDKMMMQDFDGLMTSSKQESAKNFLRDLHEFRDGGKYDKIKELTDGYIHRKVLPPENVYMAKVLDFAMDAAIERHSYDKAFHYGALALTAYRNYLHECHPMTGLQVMKLGKILLYSAKCDEALQMLLESLKILQVTHSKGGLVMQELRAMITQCQAEIRHKDKK